MPIDRPTFPGEEEIDLSGATLTSASCTDPANAIDDDTETASDFGYVVPGTGKGWQDTNVTFTSDDLKPLAAIQDGFVIQPNPLLTANGRGLPEAAAAGYEELFAADPSVVPPFGITFLVLEEGDTPSPTIEEDPVDGVQYSSHLLALSYIASEKGSTRVHGVFTVEQLTAAIAGYTSGTFRVWVIHNDQYHPDNNGAVSVVLLPLENVEAFNPCQRFLRVDWHRDYWVSRIRLAMSGAGAENVAVESSLGAIAAGTPDEGPDVPIAYIPLPADGNVHELTFYPPTLARGVVFYPDYYSPDIADIAFVTVSQLSVYSDESLSGEEEMPNPTQTTKKFRRVGVKQMTIYPYNSTDGPYDATTELAFAGLQALDMGETSTTAIFTGSETVFQQGSEETQREIKFKLSVQSFNLRALAILQGGTFIVDPANGGLGEVQYHAPSVDDEAPYFRFVGYSTKGGGGLSIVLPKCKISASVNYNASKDNPTNLEVEFTAYWDDTYVRKDGSVGGIRELLWGEKGEKVLHS